MPTSREVPYEADGREMVGHLALPDGDGVRPAVLVAHEAPGLDDTYRDRADQLAGLGYVAFALDCHGGGRFDMGDETRSRVAALRADPDRMRAIATAGLETMLAEPRADTAQVAAIGYCLGGVAVLELARSGAELQAVVGFHPGFGTVRPEDSHNITGKVLVCVGTEDPHGTPEERRAFEEEMRAAGVDWRMNLYGGTQHSFTNPRADLAGVPGLSYHPLNAERSWQAMLDLFDEVFSATAPEDAY